MRATIHIERLRRLSEHLASYRLTRDYSDTTVLMCMNNLYFHAGRTFTLPPWFVEELDYLFPEHFERNPMGYVIPLFSKKTSVEFVLPWFFGINSEEYQQLFIPNKQCYSDALTALAKPEQ